MNTSSSAKPAAHPRLAVVFILTAMALMGLVDNFVATIAETTGIWQFQVIRSAMALGLLMAVARWRGWRLRPYRWMPVIARSFVISCSLIIYFAALAVLPISEAVAGLFTAPFFVLLLSVGFFGHSIGPVRITMVILGFVGVMMVLRPDAGAITWLSAVPLLSGVFYALAALATREWCEGESPLTLVFGFFAAMGLWGVFGLVGLSIWPQEALPGPEGFLLRFWGDMSGEAWAWTVAQAVFSLIAVGLITRAYQLGEASFVAGFEYALLIFAVFWGFVLLGITVDFWALAGIALIILSGVVLAIRQDTSKT